MPSAVNRIAQPIKVCELDSLRSCTQRPSVPPQPRVPHAYPESAQSDRNIGVIDAQLFLTDLESSSKKLFTLLLLPRPQSMFPETMQRGRDVRVVGA